MRTRRARRMINTNEVLHGPSVIANTQILQMTGLIIRWKTHPSPLRRTWLKLPTISWCESLPRHGIGPTITWMPWEFIREAIPQEPMPIYLLWGLSMMNVYAPKSFYEIISGLCPKTSMNWPWIVIKAMDDINTVSFNSMPTAVTNPS